MFYHNFTSTTWHFQPLMYLTIESPSLTVTGSFLLSEVSLSDLSLEFCVFWVAVFTTFSLIVTFVLVNHFLYFCFQFGSPQFLIVSSDFGCITLDDSFFKGDLLASDIFGFADISSCQMLFSVCITSLFRCFCLCNYFCWLDSVTKWFDISYVINRLLCCNKE